MTFQEKKAWLSRAITAEDRARCLERQLEDLQKLYPFYEDKSAVKLFSEELTREMQALLMVKKEIRGAIATLDNERYKTILEYKYLCFLTFEEIAEILELSYVWTFELHKRAVEALAI